MRRENDGGDEEAADDRPIFRAINDRKPDDSPKKAAENPYKREFEDIVIPSNEKCPPDLTAKIAPQSAESLPPVPNATERLELDIDLDDDLNLGLKINEKLFIEGFKKMGPQELKFTIGDQIICVNGRNIKTVAHYQRLLQKYGPHIRISVFRPMYTTKAHQFRLNKHGYTLSHIRENFIDDQFLIAHVTYRPSVHLGLTINSNGGIVVISRVDKDSLAFQRFEIGDIIIDVEGERVKDKNDFRNFMMDAMDRNSYASVLIQRPFSPKSIELAQKALNIVQKEHRDPPFPHDAMIIGRKEMQRFKRNEMNNSNKHGIHSILRQSPHAYHHLVISEEKPLELYINSDIPEGKILMPCPTRAQLHARLQARRAKKNKKNGIKAEREIINFAADANSPDTIAPPNLFANSTPVINPKPKEDSSLLRRAQDSWKEKRSKLFNSGKKDTDSETSSRRVKSKKKNVAEKEQISEQKNSNSPNNDGSDKKKKFVRGGGEADDGSERRNRNDDASERRRRNNNNDDSGKKKKLGRGGGGVDDGSERQKSKKKNVAEKEQISEQKYSNSDKSAKERSDRKKPPNNDGSDKKKKFVRGSNGTADDGSERRNRNDDASVRRRRNNNNNDSGKKK